MKRSIYLLIVLLIAACGYSSKDNELVGQVKKVSNETPLICPNYMAADISMGVMRNGVGSMSKEDVWFYVADKDDEKLLKKAAENGDLVKVFYDVVRISFCKSTDHFITKVELVK